MWIRTSRRAKGTVKGEEGSRDERQIGRGGEECCWTSRNHRPGIINSIVVVVVVVVVSLIVIIVVVIVVVVVTIAAVIIFYSRLPVVRLLSAF